MELLICFGLAVTICGSWSMWFDYWYQEERHHLKMILPPDGTTEEDKVRWSVKRVEHFHHCCVTTIHLALAGCTLSWLL